MRLSMGGVTTFACLPGIAVLPLLDGHDGASDVDGSTALYCDWRW
jgi:hypothetical protein